MSCKAAKLGLEVRYRLRLFLCLAVLISASPVVFGEDVPPEPAAAESVKPALSDVPSDHWAADSVAELTELGIMKGYPDSTFRGDRPVTRYELAVALSNFVRLLRPEAPSPQPSPARGEGEKADHPSWATNSVNLLVLGEYFASDSPIITDGSKSVTAEDLAQALASVASRLVEGRTADPGPQEMQ